MDQTHCRHFFPLERRCDHDIWDQQEEVEYIIPREGKFSESDIQTYSHEDAVKGSGTSLMSTGPLSPMQDILFTVIYRKCDNRVFFLMNTQWRIQESNTEGTHSLPIVLSQTHMTVRG